MNRTAALLLALTTLLAHSLLIHQDSAGQFAAPYEAAHAAFRVARNLVHTGEAAWNPGALELEAVASPLWVFMCAIAERLYIPVTTFAQSLGILCMFATTVLAARFTPDRLVGVIAPFLLVVNGGIAAAGPGGTEVSLLTLLVTTAFLAHERRRSRTLAVAASLLWLTRWEGGCVVIILLSFELMRILRGRAGPRFLLAFVAPLVTGIVTLAIRFSKSGQLFSPAGSGIANGSPELGFPYLREFVLTSGTPLLVLIPIAYLLRGRLVGRARRGLFMAGAWSVFVVWTGGDGLPFWSAMVPVLPLVFLAVQDALTLACDGKRRWVGRACVTLLLVGAAVSTLASKLPGNIGPLPRVPLPRNWIEPDPGLVTAYDRPPGRTGLVREIQFTDRLRSIGIFLRDNLSGRATVLTPWPGTIGYLSRRVVYDMRGRATLAPEQERLSPWYGAPRADVVEQLRARPDYVVGWVDPGRPPTGSEEYARELLRRFDSTGETKERLAETLVELDAYELIAIPVAAHSGNQEVSSEYPAYLLRRREMRLTPRLGISRDGTSFSVNVTHRGHFQLADLVVTAEDANKQLWYLRPTGRFQPGAEVRARTRLLVYGSGSRGVNLIDGTLPPELASARVRAELRNPGSNDAASREASAR